MKTRQKPPTDKTLSRRVAELGSVDEETRKVEAALSSEAPVRRFFGNEILRHEEDSIDLSRAVESLPLLYGHSDMDAIGRVENIRIGTDKKLRGTLHFSNNNARARETFDDVRDGFLRDVSIGYRIEDYEDGENEDDVIVTRWMPLEASIVAVPADSTVGVNRKGLSMPDEIKRGTEAPTDGLTIASLRAVRERNLKEGSETGRTEERARTRQIRERFVPYLDRGREFIDLMDACIDNGESEVRSMELLLELVGQSNGGPSVTQYVQRGETMQDAAAPTYKHQRVEVREDGFDKWKVGAEQSLLVRANLATDEQKQANLASEHRGMTMAEMARSYLDQISLSVRGMDRKSIIGNALTRAIGHGSSDFANLLANVANKSLQIGYDEAPETWQMWASRATTSDYKIFERSNLSGFSDLARIEEGGEYTYGTFLDEKEVARLVKYGRMFSITREAIINDDLQAMSSIPRAMGRAASRMVGDLAYGVITANANMADGNALMVAAHANINSTGSVTPTVTAIEAVRAAMALQTDPMGNTLNIRPAYLLCPVALEGTVRVLQQGQYDPAGTAGTLTPNTVAGTFEVVSDPRLDANSAVDWYMFANQSAFSTIEVTFLEGAESPFLEEKQGWNVDGVEYKVRMDAVAKALNWRGVYKVDN